MDVGVDVLELAVFTRLFSRRAMIERVFTDAEINLVNTLPESRRVLSLAQRFAIKEAAVKALGTGFAEGVEMKCVEVLDNTNGLPVLNLLGKAQQRAQSAGYSRYHASATVAGHTVIGTVYME